MQEMCLLNSGTDDEQMSVRHADASGGDVTANQHDGNRMRHVHIGRGSEAASLSKKVRAQPRLPTQLCC